MRRLERLATLWLWGRLLSDGMAWIIVLVAWVFAGVCGWWLWRELVALARGF